MSNTESVVTIHMAASLDGYIARPDGRVDWMETSDVFEGGATMEPAVIEAFLKTIDCYVMGSRTYELALSFEARGFGWAYGEKPVIVLTSRMLPKLRGSIEFYSGDLANLITGQLRARFSSIWVVGGGSVCTQCIQLGLADEIRYAILPVLIGAGKPFFEHIDHDVALHLMETRAYKNGMVELRYQVKK